MAEFHGGVSTKLATPSWRMHVPACKLILSQPYLHDALLKVLAYSSG